MTTSTLLDVCYTDITHVSKSGVIEWNVSNHLPIFLIKKKFNPPEQKTTFTGRDYTQLNSKDLKADLLNMPLDRILSESNPERAWEIYFGYIINITYKYCPQKTFTKDCHI